MAVKRDVAKGAAKRESGENRTTLTRGHGLGAVMADGPKSDRPAPGKPADFPGPRESTQRFSAGGNAPRPRATPLRNSASYHSNELSSFIDLISHRAIRSRQIHTPPPRGR